MDSRQIIKTLEAAGWQHKRTTGSHWHFWHPARRVLVTVPHPKRDLPTGTVKAIERQSGLKLLSR
ncbi:type II toxin-antitoxin system HicA family toxin [Shumkonia mesophila]|uniref:type II toxin-antitoxin system HicA family toxin n=1 Tax=Shumkonia mesophila TaxID=2838854 RepID=UPI0029343C26|nr:type II toxin-antitoxin system HicA family toxin [Shumkonia mesophila]